MMALLTTKPTNITTAKREAILIENPVKNNPRITPVSDVKMVIIIAMGNKDEFKIAAKTIKVNMEASRKAFPNSLSLSC